MPAIVIPSARGRAALDELDRVAWHELAHAYGKGVTGDALWHDVKASLARLADRDSDALDDTVYALTCNIYHQGTIYEATAPAVPFLAAFAAGEDVWIGHARDVACVIGSIAISSSFETTDGTMSGSFGDDVAESTRAALRASAELLAKLAELRPALADLVNAIDVLVRANAAQRRYLQAIADEVDALNDVDFGDPPREPVAPTGPEWITHKTFGAGLVLRREDDKLRVRFTDGTERVLAARFVTPTDPPDAG